MASALARSGAIGSWKTIGASAARMPSAASAMSGEWAATLTGQHLDDASAEALGSGRGGLHGDALATDHDLAG